MLSLDAHAPTQVVRTQRLPNYVDLIVSHILNAHSLDAPRNVGVSSVASMTQCLEPNILNTCRHTIAQRRAVILIQF